MKKPLSRQRLMQLKMQSLGRCGICGKPVHQILQRCDPCADRASKAMRERKGCNQKVWGGPGRPKKCLDETGTQVTNEVALMMSKADYSLNNRDLAQQLNVSENTVSRYRKIYGPGIFATTGSLTTIIALKMAKADYSLSNKDLIFSMGVSQPTVKKYRSIYAPETVKPPRRYTKKKP
jgi:DNA-binding transcriptional regulator YhcF (GntR family)